MLNQEIALNTHYRPQLLVGLGLSLWLYTFLVLVGPFDASDLRWHIRFIIMPGYGVVFFLCYLMLIPVQNKLYYIREKWTLGYELAMVTLFCLYALPACFAYYKTDLVNGLFSFNKFSLTVYLPTVIILLPFIFVARYIAARYQKSGKTTTVEEKTVTLLGENKLDILKLSLSDLVLLEAANNYVVVYYLLNGELQKKMLRTSLKKLHQTTPSMTQVHRSYLVNMDHFVAWKDGLTLTLTQVNVPVSQKYKSSLLAMTTFTPN